MKLLIFLLSLFIIGCSNYNDTIVDFALIGDWQDSEIKIIQDSLREWEIATNGTVVATTHKEYWDFDFDSQFREDTTPIIVLLNEEDTYRMKTWYYLVKRKGLAGYASEQQILITKDHRTEYDAFKYLMLHELGHYWGLTHQDGILMSVEKDVPNITCIDHEAISVFCDHHDCNDGWKETCHMNEY